MTSKYLQANCRLLAPMHDTFKKKLRLQWVAAGILLDLFVSDQNSQYDRWYIINKKKFVRKFYLNHKYY